MAFQVLKAFPGVWHIRDAMGVCMTLVVGKNSAVLLDAGYGLEDVLDFVSSMMDRPCRLILTHGHHDHALGARWFDDVWIHPAELPVWQVYTDREHRRRVLGQAKERGIPTEDEERFLTAPMPSPRILEAPSMDLGGLTLQTIHCPGHTPGSLMFFIPEYRLLLTGDNWNPCTWLFFPEAVNVLQYKRNMLRALSGLDFVKVLCPHQFALYDASSLGAFLNGLTEACLDIAADTPEGDGMGIMTGRALPAEGQMLVFDRNKYLHAREAM